MNAGREEHNKVTGVSFSNRRVESGIFYSILSFLSPFSAFLWFRFAPTFTTTEVMLSVLPWILFGITLFWAAAVVKCVSDIARVYSKAGRYGLFLVLISPVLWLIAIVNYFYYYIQEVLSSFGSWLF